jgi:hypothetical protein
MREWSPSTRTSSTARTPLGSGRWTKRACSLFCASKSLLARMDSAWFIRPSKLWSHTSYSRWDVRLVR